MVETYLRQSPLAHRALDAQVTENTGDAALVLTERRFLAKVNIRGKADSDAVKAAIGVALPSQHRGGGQQPLRAVAWPQ